MDKRQTPKALTVIANVILYTFIVVSIVGVILTITAKRDEDGTATVFGMQMRYVLSPSMEKCEATNTDDFEIKDIKTNSMVFIKVVPTDEKKALEWYGELRRGDVLTFKYVYTTQETITHRIVDIEKKLDEAGEIIGYVFFLEGDNKATDSGVLQQRVDTTQKNSPNYVIGKVVGQSYPLGAFVGILKKPVGIICVIILPCLAIVGYEAFKISRILGEEKRQKDKEEKKRQQSELDELRRRLKELEENAAPKGEGEKNSVNNGEEP